MQFKIIVIILLNRFICHSTCPSDWTLTNTSIPNHGRPENNGIREVVSHSLELQNCSLTAEVYSEKKFLFSALLTISLQRIHSSGL